jgi:tetratricopeptide (TPR) repeat protein
MSRIEELEKRLAADPNSRMFVQLAEEYRKAGLLEQAIEVCEEGIKKHPQYPSSRVALGRALLEAEAFDRASEQFETVLKSVPDNILANKFLGETYHRLGRLDEALKKYQVAQTLAPEDLELGDRIAAVQSELAAGPPAPAAPSPPVPPAPRAAPLSPPAVPPGLAVEELQARIEPERSTEQESGGALEDDLPPIPLVDVDEPMVLEDRFSALSVADTPPSMPDAPPEAAEAEPFVEAESLIEPEPFLDTEHFVEPTFEPEVAVAPEPPARPATPTLREAPSAPTEADLETRTMAELYASQGHLDQAIGVYEKLVDRRPEEATYRTRLDELKMLERATRQAQKPAPAPPKTAPAATPPPAPSTRQEPGDKTIEVLSGWLDAIKKSKES